VNAGFALSRRNDCRRASFSAETKWLAGTFKLPQEANMANKTLARYAAASAVAAALSLATATAGFAAPHWHAGAAGGPHWGAGAAIGAGVAGFALGAAAAGVASPYYGYYDYAPGDYYAADPSVVAPDPYYDEAPPFGIYGSGWRRPGQCRFTIRGC
jgi:hypothetical protein